MSTPVSGEITEMEEFTGHTESLKTICVRARVSGYLEKVLFKEGAEVQEGDPLFLIDRRTYQADYDRAVANLAQARAHLTRMEANYKRAQDLIATRAISQADFDQAVGDRDEADGGGQGGRGGAEHRPSQPGLDPRDGPHQRPHQPAELIDPGNMVKADDTILTTIVSLDPMYAYFDIDERATLQSAAWCEAGKVKSARDGKTPVYLGLADEEGFPHEGTINFIDNQVDMPTGTLAAPRAVSQSQRILSPGHVRADPGAHRRPASGALGAGAGHGLRPGAEVPLCPQRQGRGASIATCRSGAFEDGLRVIKSGLKPGRTVHRQRPAAGRPETKVVSQARADRRWRSRGRRRRGRAVRLPSAAR